MCFLSKGGGTVSPSYLETLLFTNKSIISINGKAKLFPPQKLIWSRILSMKNRKKCVIFFSCKIDVIMFEIKKTLFSWAAFRYDKIIIEIREWVRVEKSAIIHCALVKSFFVDVMVVKTLVFHGISQEINWILIQIEKIVSHNQYFY